MKQIVIRRNFFVTVLVVLILLGFAFATTLDSPWNWVVGVGSCIVFTSCINLVIAKMTPQEVHRSRDDSKKVYVLDLDDSGGQNYDSGSGIPSDPRRPVKTGGSKRIDLDDV